MFQSDLTEYKPNILLDKDGIKLEKQTNGSYHTSFDIINNKLNLVDIITFDLLNLICDLNPDIFDSIKIYKINEEEANVVIVMKHLFKDIGIPQKYLYLNIQLSCPNSSLLKFTSMSIICKRPEFVPINAEVVELGRIETMCKIITQNHISINNYTYIDNITTSFVDKITSSMTFKIIKRISKFVSEYKPLKV